MTVSTIAALLGAFTAVLSAEEILLTADLPALAGDVRAVIEVVRNKARETIEVAAAVPGDALDRVALLRHAIDFEGADGPLVARVVSLLAAATENRDAPLQPER